MDALSDLSQVQTIDYDLVIVTIGEELTKLRIQKRRRKPKNASKRRKVEEENTRNYKRHKKRLV
jgi:hypothetical protein